MTLLQTAPPPDAPPLPPVRLRALVPLVLAVALLAAWAVTARADVLVPGSVSTYGSLQPLSDGVVETRLVAPDGRGELVVSLRNRGRVPVTVRPRPDEQDGSLLTVDGLQLLDARGGGPDLAAPWREVVRVPAGREAAVRLRLVRPCATYDEGSATSRESVTLRVSSLGITTEQALPLPLPVTVRGPLQPGPECR